MIEGIDAIKRHEGLRLDAYPDPASGGEPWTIGYGHTGGVKRGDRITQEQAEQFLADDVATCQAAIDACVTVPLTEGQRWALTSFAFNLGVGALRKSTLLRKLNAGDYQGAADEFGRWVNAAGKPMPGLVKRRADERTMFLDGVQESPQEGKPMLPLIPILAAVLPTIAEAIPSLGKLFGSGSDVSERNAKAAALAVDIVQQAVGASNAQQAAEIVANDPAMAQVAREAVEARWLDLTEAGGGGIKGAREADAAFAAAGRKSVESPAFIISVVLLLMPFMLLTDVLFVHPGNYSGELRTQVVTGVLMVIGAVGAFWLGSSFGSMKKTESATKDV